MSKHPGVGILSPSGRNGYRLKYRDPDTGKTKRETPKAAYHVRVVPVGTVEEQRRTRRILGYER